VPRSYTDASMVAVSLTLWDEKGPDLGVMCVSAVFFSAVMPVDIFIYTYFGASLVSYLCRLRETTA
jgi:hypothetical protein